MDNIKSSAINQFQSQEIKASCSISRSSALRKAVSFAGSSTYEAISLAFKGLSEAFRKVICEALIFTPNLLKRIRKQDPIKNAYSFRKSSENMLKCISIAKQIIPQTYRNYINSLNKNKNKTSSDNVIVNSDRSIPTTPKENVKTKDVLLDEFIEPPVEKISILEEEIGENKECQKKLQIQIENLYHFIFGEREKYSHDLVSRIQAKLNDNSLEPKQESTKKTSAKLSTLKTAAHLIHSGSEIVYSGSKKAYAYGKTISSNGKNFVTNIDLSPLKNQAEVLAKSLDLQNKLSVGIESIEGLSTKIDHALQKGGKTIYSGSKKAYARGKTIFSDSKNFVTKIDLSPLKNQAIVLAKSLDLQNKLSVGIESIEGLSTKMVQALQKFSETAYACGKTIPSGSKKAYTYGKTIYSGSKNFVTKTDLSPLKNRVNVLVKSLNLQNKLSIGIKSMQDLQTSMVHALQKVCNIVYSGKLKDQPKEKVKLPLQIEEEVKLEENVVEDVKKEEKETVSTISHSSSDQPLVIEKSVSNFARPNFLGEIEKFGGFKNLNKAKIEQQETEKNVKKEEKDTLKVVVENVPVNVPALPQPLVTSKNPKPANTDVLSAIKDFGGFKNLSKGKGKEQKAESKEQKARKDLNQVDEDIENLRRALTMRRQANGGDEPDSHAEPISPGEKNNPSAYNPNSQTTKRVLASPQPTISEQKPEQVLVPPQPTSSEQNISKQPSRFGFLGDIKAFKSGGLKKVNIQPAEKSSNLANTFTKALNNTNQKLIKNPNLKNDTLKRAFEMLYNDLYENSDLTKEDFFEKFTKNYGAEGREILEEFIQNKEIEQSDPKFLNKLKKHLKSKAKEIADRKLEEEIEKNRQKVKEEIEKNERIQKERDEGKTTETKVTATRPTQEVGATYECDDF